MPSFNLEQDAMGPPKLPFGVTPVRIIRVETASVKGGGAIQDKNGNQQIVCQIQGVNGAQATMWLPLAGNLKWKTAKTLVGVGMTSDSLAKMNFRDYEDLAIQPVADAILKDRMLFVRVTQGTLGKAFIDPLDANDMTEARKNGEWKDPPMQRTEDAPKPSPRGAVSSKTTKQMADDAQLAALEDGFDVPDVPYLATPQATTPEAEAPPTSAADVQAATPAESAGSDDVLFDEPPSATKTPDDADDEMLKNLPF